MAPIKRKSNFDTNRDGTVTDSEIEHVRLMLEVELQERKAETQKKMAWTAMASMLVFTTLLFAPVVSEGRVSALADLLGLFYIAQAGIVGAYMGITAWMNKGSSAQRGELRNYEEYSSRREDI